MISLKLGRLLGSLSQHFFIRRAKAYGVFFGMLGRRSLFSTSIDTYKPVKSELRKESTAVGRLSGSDLPQDNTEAEDICFLGILLAADDFRGHPLVCADLARHVLIQALGPAEVCQLHPV